jgi:Ca2+-binding EF-hand superfamily protein
MVELLMWRGLRHEFLFPHNEFSERDGELVRRPEHNIIRVREPEHFQFHHYLSKCVVDMFVELVEIEIATWTVCLLLSPVIAIMLQAPRQDFEKYLSFLGVLSVCLLSAIGIHIYNIHTKLCVMLPSDPVQCLRVFTGTSAFALSGKGNRDSLAVLSKKITKDESNGSSPSSKKGPAMKIDVDGLLNHLTQPLLTSDAQEIEVHNGISRIPPYYVCYDDSGRLPSRKGGGRPTKTRRKSVRPIGGMLGAWISWLCGNEHLDHIPNKHEALFLGGKHGPNLIRGSLQTIQLLMAVYNAVLIVNIVMASSHFTPHQWFWFLFAWVPSLINLLYLMPRIATKFSVVTCVETMKKGEIMEVVMQERRQEQLKETLRMLHFLKLRGRVHHLDRDPNVLQRAASDFNRLDPRLQDEAMGLFHFVDTDMSETIDVEEFKGVMKSMGIKEDSHDYEGLMGLFRLIDVDNSGELNEDEFKMLISLALSPRSEEEESEDTAALFDFFDDDHSGHITLEEVMIALDGLGAKIDQAYLDATIYECFQRMKIDLTKSEFIKWMQFLEAKLSGNSKDLGSGEA